MYGSTKASSRQSSEINIDTQTQSMPNNVDSRIPNCTRLIQKIFTQIKILAVAALLLVARSAFADTLFPNSVVSNDIEFLSTDDVSAFYCLKHFGTETREMPDKRSDELMADGVHDFEAWFLDGTAVGIWAHPSVGDTEQAKVIANQVTGPLGRLPSFMRQRLRHVVIHHGDETAFAEDLGQFFVLYDGNMAKRVSTNDLEETVFHESVHATLDASFGQSGTWRAAQAADTRFVTDYAASLPDQEDLAETALFAYTYFQRPERLDDALRANLEATIPNKLTALESLFAADQVMQVKIENLEPCNG